MAMSTSSHNSFDLEYYLYYFDISHPKFPQQLIWNYKICESMSSSSKMSKINTHY
jgi:hypothetical protein